MTHTLFASLMAADAAAPNRLPPTTASPSAVTPSVQTEHVRLPAKVPADSAEPFLPHQPTTLEETGLLSGEVEALVLKYLLQCGSARGRQIAAHIHLPAELVTQLLAKLRAELLIVYTDSNALGDFTYRLTEPGAQRANMCRERSNYCGPAPVPLAQYAESVRRQSPCHLRPSFEQLRRAFGELSMTKEMLEQVGEAITAGRGLFLYGSPGNGKTSIAERVMRAYGEFIWVPWTLSVDGDLIRVYDPSVHDALPLNDVAHAKTDRRWVLIQRPTVIVGGELTMEHLEIRFNQYLGIQEAPVHVKANGGTMVVDDFGRQRVSTTDLLNRWIVPLEKHVDYLNLPSGRQLEVPIEQLLILSTNLEPRDLVDEAFLRRIPYKIHVEDPTPEEFRQLFRQLCAQVGVRHREDAVEHLLEHHYRRTERPLRYCHVRDLLRQVSTRCRFLQQPADLTIENVECAVHNYFGLL